MLRQQLTTFSYSALVSREVFNLCVSQELAEAWWDICLGAKNWWFCSFTDTPFLSKATWCFFAKVIILKNICLRAVVAIAVDTRKSPRSVPTLKRDTFFSNFLKKELLPSFLAWLIGIGSQHWLLPVGLLVKDYVSNLNDRHWFNWFPTKLERWLLSSAWVKPSSLIVPILSRCTTCSLITVDWVCTCRIFLQLYWTLSTTVYIVCWANAPWILRCSMQPDPSVQPCKAQFVKTLIFKVPQGSRLCLLK